MVIYMKGCLMSEISETLRKKYQDITDIVERAGGKFISIEFIKKDGTYRKMNIQPAAGKFHVKGETASEQAQRAAQTRKENNPNLLNVWDVQKHAFRSVNMDTVRAVTADGKRYIVDEFGVTPSAPE